MLPSPRRKSTLSLTAAALALLSLSALDPNGLRKALRNEADAARVERENAALAQRVAQLRREVRALRGDPAALERAARELGYVKEGELVYKLDGGGEP